MSVNYQVILQAVRGPWLPIATNIVILVLFIWWLVSYAVPMFEQKQEIVATPIITKEVRTSTQPSLKNLDLFGTVEKTKSKSNISEAKPTKLNLILKGILATEDPSQGFAQIQNANNEEKHFVVNDSVFGKATLEEIYVDRVILLHNGRYETLVLPEEFLNTKHFLVENIKLERKKIATNFRDLLLNRDADALSKLFGFDTAWKNGGFAGFIVKALGDKGREMMETLGIKDGDLIVAVNGLRFSESLEASQQLTSLKTATSVDIIIERDGQEIPFHVEFDAPLEDIADISGANTQNLNAGANNQPGGSSDNYENNATSPAPGTNYIGGGVTNESGNISTNNSSSNSGSGDSGSDNSPGYSTNTSTIKRGTPSKSFDEKEEAEEFKRKQRERTTGTDQPVEYDH